MATNITEDDEGKPVVQGDQTVGRIVNVEGGTAHVDPDPDVTDTIKSKLGWEDESDTESYPLREDAIAEVTGDEVRLRENM